MRLLLGCLLAVNLLAFSGCSENRSAKPAAPMPSQTVSKDEQLASSAEVAAGYVDPNNGSRMRALSAPTEDGSLAKADSAQAASEAIERKIIRNGKLAIEVDSPTAGQSKITSIAESLGGFVITSEFKQGGTTSSETVIITVRVPASQFNEALEKIRTTGNHIINENVTGQDVTEEFLDLEARIKTKKALEAQFLEIMKQAKNVTDALEVQNEISNVRTEIERMEGRKRFLQNQASLSTIMVTLQAPMPVSLTTSTTGFSHSIKQAFADGIDIAASIVLGLIRLIIVMIPIILFILLPIALVLKLALRRLRAGKKAEPVAQTQS
jgi:hypothetical protein